MKKTLLLSVIALLGLVFAQAQVLSVNPGYEQVSILSTDYSGEGVAYIQNNSNFDRIIKWVREVESEPSGWYTTVCDDNNCYAPNISSKEVTVDANSQGLLKLNIFPGGQIGSASYTLFVYDVNDSANANGIFVVDVTAEGETGISGVSDNVVSIYPNPVKDMLYMNLDGSRHITSVDIHNIVGQKIKTINLQDGVKSVAIPVSDLKKGVYFLRVFSNGKEVVTKTFSKD